MENNPDLIETVTRLGLEANEHAMAQRYDEAISCLRHALAINPDLHHAHRHLWALNELRGTLAAALEAFRCELMHLVRQSSPATPVSQRVIIEGTTLCAVDCLHPELTIAAMQRCLADCAFDAVKLLTSHTVPASGIDVQRIAPLTSSRAYSEFMIKQLVDHIDTDHVLIVQWDGFVSHPECWTPEFLLHDYVGARWPDALITAQPDYAVGNGGFSLRSRSLLRALRDARVARLHPEDYAICIDYRALLEHEYGMAFANAGSADRFAYEHCMLDHDSFGFHGVVNMSRHLPWQSLKRFDFFE